MTAISFKIPDLDDQDTDHSPSPFPPRLCPNWGYPWWRLPPPPILTAVRLGGVLLEGRCCQFRNISAYVGPRENAKEKVPEGRVEISWKHKSNRSLHERK